MSKIRFTINTCALLIFLSTITSAASALPLRTYISASGNNANPCAQAQPCRTFAGAINKTEAGGEITALDTGEYGVVTITKGITLQAAPGAYAVLTPAENKDGVVVRAGQADVVLRGLTIAGGGLARYGISVKSVKSLHVESCVIYRFTNSSIAFTPDSFATNVFLKDTIMRGNGGPCALFIPASGNIAVSIINCRLEDSGVGLLAIGGGTVIAMRDSVVAGNRSSGVSIEANTEVNIDDCMVSNNGTLGISAKGGAIARVSNSTITNNALAGFSNNSFDPGVIETRGNNTMRGNNPDTAGTITTISGK